MTVGGGWRCSAANAYLRPAMKRANLACVPCPRDTHPVRRRSCHRPPLCSGWRRPTRCARGARVIVSTGSVNSPQLLKLSGVGPAAELREHGIAGRPRHGRASARTCRTISSSISRWPPRSRVTLYSSWACGRARLIGARLAALQGRARPDQSFRDRRLIRSRAGVPLPDIQFHFLPLAVAYDGSSLAKEHGFQAHVGPMRSKSRGQRAAGVGGSPAHLRRFASTTLAIPTILSTCAPACASRARSFRSLPSLPIVGTRSSRAPASRPMSRSMPSSVRKSKALITRPARCRMGRRDDPMAVVDIEARVLGVEGCESSILRSCRRSRPATSMRRRSCSPKGGRTTSRQGASDAHCRAFSYVAPA